MFKRTFTACIIFASSSSLVFAQAAPYVGGSLGITNGGGGWYDHGYNYWRGPSALVAELFAGYGGTVGMNHNIYLGGEVNANAETLHYYGTNYNLGLSFIPGIMLNKDTMIYARVGENAQMSFHNFGLELGMGMQTKVSEHVEVRGEVVQYNGYGATNQFKLGLLYKFG